MGIRYKTVRISEYASLRSIVKDKNLGTEKILLMYFFLSLRSGDFYNPKKIMKDLGIKDCTLYRQIKKLKEKNYIFITDACIYIGKSCLHEWDR
jgi:DNA-binding MarR family transcriptional regulator